MAKTLHKPVEATFASKLITAYKGCLATVQQALFRVFLADYYANNPAPAHNFSPKSKGKPRSSKDTRHNKRGGGGAASPRKKSKVADSPRSPP